MSYLNISSRTVATKFSVLDSGLGNQMKIAMKDIIGMIEKVCTLLN